MRKLGFLVGLLILAATPASAQNCNQSSDEVASVTTLPGQPFSAIPTPDGCSIFVSLMAQGQQTPAHIAVFQRSGGKVRLAQNVELKTRAAAGMALSHDGKVLAVADQTGVMLLDTTRLAAGDGTPIIEATDANGKARQAGSVYVAISADDKLLFVSDENTASITLYDLEKLRNGDTSAIGAIPVGSGPVGLAFSPDGLKLYTTAEIAPPGSTPATCAPEAGGGGNSLPQGVLTVIDVARAARDPANSVLAKVPAGCDPVRVALSADGRRTFVTARGQDALLIFDTAKLVSDSDHALLSTVAAGKSPVGVASMGGKIFVADSNRFDLAGRKGEWLSVIDASTGRVIDNIPTGLFPRELSITRDGDTLLVTNFGSSSLGVVDLARVTNSYFAQQAPLKEADDEALAKIRAAADERTRNHQASPGTEAALRHVIEGMAKGQPDFDIMGPGLAAATRAQSAGISAVFKNFGAFQDISFKSANIDGSDTFLVTFEHAKADFNILLSSDGKISLLNFRPASP